MRTHVYIYIMWAHAPLGALPLQVNHNEDKYALVRGWSAGTRFTSFTRAKEQILTQKAGSVPRRRPGRTLILRSLFFFPLSFSRGLMRQGR